MKQITSNTVLIQGDKSYPAIQTEQGIVWIDKDAEIKENDWLYDTSENSFYQSGSVYKKTKLLKIISANFDLEGIPKIELEDEIEKVFKQHFGIGKDEPFPQTQGDNNIVDYFKEGYKANQAKYTEENAEKIYMKGYMNKTDGKDHTNEKLSDYLQSLNSIKEITVDENFKQI